MLLQVTHTFTCLLKRSACQVVEFYMFVDMGVIVVSEFSDLDGRSNTFQIYSHIQYIKI